MGTPLLAASRAGSILRYVYARALQYLSARAYDLMVIMGTDLVGLEACTLVIIVSPM